MVNETLTNFRFWAVFYLSHVENSDWIVQKFGSDALVEVVAHRGARGRTYRTKCIQIRTIRLYLLPIHLSPYVWRQLKLRRLFLRLFSFCLLSLYLYHRRARLLRHRQMRTILVYWRYILWYHGCVYNVPLLLDIMQLVFVLKWPMGLVVALVPYEHSFWGYDAGRLFGHCFRNFYNFDVFCWEFGSSCVGGWVPIFNGHSRHFLRDLQGCVLVKAGGRLEIIVDLVSGDVEDVLLEGLAFALLFWSRAFETAKNRQEARLLLTILFIH